MAKSPKGIKPSPTKITGSWSFNNAPSIVINGANNKPILEVKYDGTVIWHAEDQASEAARIFCNQMHISIEQKAGIKQTRKEWEDKKIKEISKALQNGELTMQKLEEIFKKHEFINKLAGNE